MSGIEKVRSLLERLERTETGGSGWLCESSGNWRYVSGPDEFFEVLDGVPNGRFVTFGYVSAAKIVVPKGKRLNPQTNRMNQFDDYAQLGRNLGVEDSELIGVIKLMTYNMRWQTAKNVADQYATYKKTRDELAGRYGVEVGSSRYGTDNMRFGKSGGVSSYAGGNEANMGHTYTNLNMSGIRPKSVNYFLILSDGTIREISEDKLEKLPAKPNDSIIEKLKSAGASEADVEPLTHMKYQRFEHSHLLFFSCTSDGIPTVYINTKLSDKIGGITNANPQELIKLAMERYSLTA
ncbi:MAG: hypothetical protein J6X18_08535 [Bacteroidales bacterium]|nr:hypothetical protein [Bacteroidales bacterium]